MLSGVYAGVITLGPLLSELSPITPYSGFFAGMILHTSPNCLPVQCGFSPRILVIPDYTLDSLRARFHTFLPLVSQYALDAWLVNGWSALVSHLSACLPAVSVFFAGMILHLSPSCLPLHPGFSARDFTLVFHCCLMHPICSECECSGSYDFTLAFHSSPICFLLHLGFFARMIVHLSPTCTCVSHLLLCISNFFVTCGLLVSDLASRRQQEFQISNHGASNSGTANFARSQ